jgi:uncharacterized protein YjbI with pentapeptide repeats
VERLEELPVNLQDFRRDVDVLGAYDCRVERLRSNSRAQLRQLSLRAAELTLSRTRARLDHADLENDVIRRAELVTARVSPPEPIVRPH